MIVTGGESNHQAELAVSPEPKHFPDGAQEHEAVSRSCGHADEPPHGLAVGASGFLSRQERNEPIGSPRQRPLLARIDTKDQWASIPLLDEPTERRRQGRLRAKMGLRAFVVEEDEPTLTVDGLGGSAEEVVQPYGHRLQSVVDPQPIDAITILFAEEEVAASRIAR